MLDVDICAYDLLVLLAQPFAIELSTSHPQEINHNNIFIVWGNTFTF